MTEMRKPYPLLRRIYRHLQTELEEAVSLQEKICFNQARELVRKQMEKEFVPYLIRKGE